MADHRPLHLVVVDGWHPGLLARERARLPAIEFLITAGLLEPACISTFPTVTPSALATLVTGASPAEHGVAGIMWYHRAEDRYVHYWPSWQGLREGSLPQVLRDIFLHLNHRHLRREVATLFETLEAAGVRCASVNFPFSRSTTLHRARLPWLVARLGGMERELAQEGPETFWAGDFLVPAGFGPQGLWGRYGLNDRRAAEYAAELIRRQRPDFSLIYLNEHDLRSHHAGPLGCAYSLRLIDRQLARMMEAYGSWEKAVEQARWILVGDHSQSRVGGFAGYAVRLLEAVTGLKVATLGGGGLMRGDAQVAIAPNDRSALVYVRDRGHLEPLIAQFSRWPSVDLLAWREGDWTVARSGTRTLRWKANGWWQDPLGQYWDLVGDWSVLDLHPIDRAHLLWGRYPDPLARLDDCLGSGVDLVASAADGYEFTTGLTMGKGNHGSLAEEDSLTPLITVGLPVRPRPWRTRDVAPAILNAFGLPLKRVVHPPTTPTGHH